MNYDPVDPHWLGQAGQGLAILLVALVMGVLVDVPVATLFLQVGVDVARLTGLQAGARVAAILVRALDIGALPLEGALFWWDRRGFWHGVLLWRWEGNNGAAGMFRA
jgi:hypothetical protein